MAYIDPEGMFGGDRMAMLSDSAKMAWSWFWCAGNTVGRVELNYREFTKTVFRQFKKPPTEQQFWDWVAEFHEAYLMFAYEVNGQVWGQWYVTEKYLPTYKAVNDKKTPAPNAADILKWQEKYTELKRSLISGKCRVFTVSKNFQIVSEVPKTSEEFHMGVERKGEERSGEEEKPYAPDGACPVVPSENRRRGAKRTADEIRSALGDRLPWWEAFWAEYPCRDAMREAMDAFERRVTTRDMAEKLYRGAKAYGARARADPDMRLKYGQGWINGERWNDESQPRMLPMKPGCDGPEGTDGYEILT